MQDDVRTLLGWCGQEQAVCFGIGNFGGQSREICISRQDGLFRGYRYATLLDGVAEHVVLKDVALVVTDGDVEAAFGFALLCDMLSQ